MAAPIESLCDVASGENSQSLCNIEATVATGFELVAKEEVEEKCGIVTKVSRGKINIKFPVEIATQVLKLQSIDNCRVVLSQVAHFGFTEDQHDNLLRLRKFVGDVDWPHGLKVWRKFFSFEHPIADVPETITDDFGEVTEPVPRQSKSEGRSSKKSKKNKRRKQKESGDKNEQEESKIHVGAAGENTVQVDNEPRSSGNLPETEAHSGYLIDKGNEFIETVSEQSTVNGENTEKVSGFEEITVERTDTGGGNNAKQEIEREIETKKPRTRINPWDPMKPAFRVTCNRVGDHNFDSMTAASNFGGAIYRYFGWNVEMKNFDIEVMLNIEDEEVTVGIGLTRESLHRRNIGHFGPTTLRPTIAYNMLRLCEIKTGDIVCDPMCGSGSIPIQSAVSWPESYNICGDVSKKCIWRIKDNLFFMKEKREKENKKQLEMDVIKWDVCNLPLRSQSVDVFITDLPFGLRIGSKLDNWKLYKSALEEMARVVRAETGRVCLLTQDKKCMIQTLQSCSRYWVRTKTLGVNIGGLAAGVYVLLRTAYQSSDNAETVGQRTNDENVQVTDT